MAAPKKNQNNLKHGKRYTRIYNIWRTMKQRCVNPKCINFHLYGGRGIEVCTEWQNSFQSFYDWSMANGYAENLTIDRKDVNGNYEPSNCRWATQKEQQNNRSNNVTLELNGINHTVGEWAEISGISITTIHARLKRGWSVERTLNTVPCVGRNQFTT